MSELATAAVPAASEKNLYNTAEAAAYLDLKTPRTLELWRVKKVGPQYIKIGGNVRYRRKDLEAFLDHQTVKTKSK